MDELKRLLKELLASNQTIHNENQELIFAQVFHDTIKGSSWLPADFAFSPGRVALGYPALYVLYRILDEVRPESILELGMGQSTKMIGLYNRENKECRHMVVEHDPEWIRFFTNHFSLPETTEVVELPITDTMIDTESGQSNVTVYVGFTERFEKEKFDFLCIDGPFGFRSPEFARIDVMGILPDCLKKQFVILFDDCQRAGEKNSFMLMSQCLAEAGIKHFKAIYSGEKSTGLIMSEDLRYLGAM